MMFIPPPMWWCFGYCYNPYYTPFSYLFFGFLFWIIKLIIFIVVFIDILRRDDLDTLEKILWILIVWFLGIIGAIIYYLLSRRNSKTKGNNGKNISSN
ncbi:PLDc N-terminal domain-containing protein [Methanocaldococcus indicus]|uniref:PLDc N-terminal domain-containing protein n=1 Tax=Methanocaldococcus indicus TaxID=213231 RepID=UPI003C6D13C8